MRYDYRIQQIIDEMESLIDCEGVNWFVQLQQWANLTRFARKEVWDCGASVEVKKQILDGPLIAMGHLSESLGRQWSQQMAVGFRQSGIAPPTEATIKQVLRGMLEQLKPIRTYFGMD